jgi:hypothetical protein
MITHRDEQIQIGNFGKRGNYQTSRKVSKHSNCDKLVSAVAIHVRAVSCKVRVNFGQISSGRETSRQILVKTTRHKISRKSVQCGPIRSMRTDGQTHRHAVVL